MKFVAVRLMVGVLSVFFFSMLPSHLRAQTTGCLSDEEVKKTIAQINSGTPQTENQALRIKLLEMQAARQTLERKIAGDPKKYQDLIQPLRESNQNQLVQVCEIVRQNGWPVKEAIGEDGLEAILSIVQSGKSISQQKEIFPVIAAAAKKGLIGNNQLAPLIDNLRVEQGAPQIFGTQTFIKDELFYLYPIQNETKVEAYRKLYGLPPLSTFMKYLLYEYGMPVLKMQLPPAAKSKDESKEADEAVTAGGLPDADNDEIVKVESNLVNLNVRVSNRGAATAAGSLNLQKSDFALFENDRQQEISFFSSTETPFDLVLLLDLSGSTSNKQDLIRKSTERFIKASRPADRIAIVTFTDDVNVISNLTDNKEELLSRVKKIKDYGGSSVWLGLQSVYEQIIKTQSAGRRSAVIMMTDGVDSSLLPRHLTPDYFPTFSDVLETVRNNQTTVIPIYLDTETKSGADVQKYYRLARQTLNMFAEESGGQVYNARRIEDLTGVYEQIINDLGKVYSLGFEPAEVSRDGTWHSLSVKILNHPELEARTKKGFYAR